MVKNVTFWNYRTDLGLQKINVSNKNDLLKEDNLKSYIYLVQDKFNLTYNESNEIEFIFFSHSFYDVVNTIKNDSEFLNIVNNLKLGITKRIVFYCEDQDWFTQLNKTQIIVDDLNLLFGADINKLYITLANVNWEYNWGNLNVSYNLGCLPYVLDKNLNLSIQYDLIHTNRTKKFFTTNNETRGARLYFYKFLIDNNLLDNFEYSFFYKHYDKEYITWDNIETDDGLPKIEDKFPVKLFDNEINHSDYYRNIKHINFDKALNGYIDIVFETSLFEKDIFNFTEKSFKSIICKKPTITFGSVTQYTGMKQLGFKEYDALIDINKLQYGFQPWENKQRLEWFLDEIKRLSQKDLEFYKNYYILNIDKIEHNYNHLLYLIETQNKEFKNLVTL